MLHFAHMFNLYGNNFNVKTKTAINGLYNSTSGGQLSAKRRCPVEKYSAPLWIQFENHIYKMLYSHNMLATLGYLGWQFIMLS